MGLVYEDMLFYNYYEFCGKGAYIKSRYNKLLLHDKYVYKLYIYSIDNIKYYLKDMIWEYLNEPIGSCYFMTLETLWAYV